MMEELIKSPELAGVVRKVLESDNIYKDNISNSALEKLLNKSVVNAILLVNQQSLLKKNMKVVKMNC